MSPRSPGPFFGVEHRVSQGCSGRAGRRSNAGGRRDAGGRNNAAAGQMVGGRKACLAGSDNYDVGLHVLIVLASRSLLGGGQTFFTTPGLS